MNDLCFCMSLPSRADVGRDGRLSVEELLPAGRDERRGARAGRGAARAPGRRRAAGGADELAGALGIVGIASVEDCAAVVPAASGALLRAVLQPNRGAGAPRLDCSRLPPGSTVRIQHHYVRLLLARELKTVNNFRRLIPS